MTEKRLIRIPKIRLWPNWIITAGCHAAAACTSFQLRLEQDFAPHTFLEDRAAVDELLELAAKRPLREFEEGLAFIRTKRDPTPENIGNWRRSLETHVSETGCVDVSRLVYAAHLGLVDEAFQAAESANLGPVGTSDDIMGPDGYRTSMLFQVRMPELRNDPRFVRLCVRLGLVDFWTATSKWPDCADEVPYDFRIECENAHQIPKQEFGF